MLTLLVVLTSASPVATGLEISSTGSLPPHERSHRNRSHALHRAQRRHPRHGFSCGPTFFTTSLFAGFVLRPESADSFPLTLIEATFRGASCVKHVLPAFAL